MLDIRTEQSALQQRFNKYYADKFIHDGYSERHMKYYDAVFEIVTNYMHDNEFQSAYELENFFTYYSDRLTDECLFLTGQNITGLPTLYIELITQFVKDNFDDMMTIARRAFDESMH